MIWQVGQQKITFSEQGLIMGILNVTPDSFSDGGQFTDTKSAVTQALQMLSDGADIIDIGGESTRPGSPPVDESEELQRTLPVIQALRSTIPAHALISIDTSKAAVAEQAVAAGADIINDVTGFTNLAMVEVAAQTSAGIVCMHMKGTPQTMQNAPSYENVIDEITRFFQQQLLTLNQAGISSERICFDPGIGFGKRLQDNLDILNQLENLRVENRPLLMGLSKKSFIAKLLEEENLDSRHAPTVALTALMAQRGANIHRVHEVKENVQALRMMEAIRAVKKNPSPCAAS